MSWKNIHHRVVLSTFGKEDTMCVSLAVCPFSDNKEELSNEPDTGKGKILSIKLREAVR